MFLARIQNLAYVRYVVAIQVYVQRYMFCRLCLLRRVRVIAPHRLPQMKLSRAVYRLPTIGKTMLQDYDDI